MLKLGLVAPMGSGKTELTKLLIAHFSGVQLSFGGPLKDQVLSYGLVEGGKIDKARDRALLQDFGQLRRAEKDACRFYNGHVVRQGREAFITYGSDDLQWSIGECYGDYWTDALESRVLPLLKTDTNLFNDDIRRENERAMLKKHGFTIIKIEVSEPIRLQRLQARDGSFDPARLNDVSERLIETLPFDFVVTNDGPIEQAWQQVIEVINIASAMSLRLSDK